MKKRYAQFLRSCIALIITVTVLYTGQAVWQNYAIDFPLDKALHDIAGVKKVTWDDGSKTNDVVSIYITLDNIADLQRTYGEINEKIEKTLKGAAYNLNIEDNRTPELDLAYYEIHYYIQKAIMDGDFPLLVEKVQEKAAASGAAAKVYVDEQNIYLQMVKGNSSLYSVVARHSNRIGGDF